MPKPTPDVLGKLAKLNKQFSQADEDQQFVLFNQAYYIVTANIQAAAKTNYFKNPALVETFSAVFASYYFEAINKLEQGESLPPAWAKMTNITNKTPRFISLLMGASAHINYDLPLAMFRVTKNHPNNDLLQDVLKIDKLLKKSGRQILNEFNEPNKRLDFVKNYFWPLYFYPVMHLIFWWRIRAWRNYQRLNKGQAWHQYATKVADYLLTLGNWLSGV